MRGRALGIAARPGFAVGRLASRLERALVGVRRPREREAVIALLDGLVRLLHRRGRGGERLRCVLVRAGRACGIDRPLGSIDFLLRWFRARGAQKEGADRDDEAAHCREV